MHTIIPGMVCRDGRAIIPFGVMGGHYQAMGHAHLPSKVFDDGLVLQAAIDLPRLFPLAGRTSSRLRHDCERSSVPSWSGVVSRSRRPIWIDWERGTLLGGSDPRKDGCALAF